MVIARTIAWVIAWVIAWTIAWVIAWVIAWTIASVKASVIACHYCSWPSHKPVTKHFAFKGVNQIFYIPVAEKKKQKRVKEN